MTSIIHSNAIVLQFIVISIPSECYTFFITLLKCGIEPLFSIQFLGKSTSFCYFLTFLSLRRTLMYSKLKGFCFCIGCDRGAACGGLSDIICYGLAEGSVSWLRTCIGTLSSGNCSKTSFSYIFKAGYYCLMGLGEYLDYRS